MRPIDADKLPRIRTGLCDAFGNMYGAGEIVLAEDIDKAPTITPERLVVHGRWVTERDDNTSKSVRCSACKKSFYFAKRGQLHIDMMPYCPNCGSKMDLEE